MAEKEGLTYLCVANIADLVSRLKQKTKKILTEVEKMRRLCLVIISLSLWLVAGLPMFSVQAEEHHRTGRFWYFIDSVTYDASQKDVVPAVLLWVALPPDRPGQKVTIQAISPKPTEILTDGVNRVAFWRIENPPNGGDLVFSYDFEVTNAEITHTIDPSKVKKTPPDSKECLRWTSSEHWTEITPEIAAMAKEIVKEEKNPWLQARLVFAWILENIAYEYPDIDHRGAKTSFANKKGDCGEYSHIFIAMMRSLGVPARTVFCNWYQGSGHAWAEIFIPPYGWIPVDPSVGHMMKDGLRGLVPDDGVVEFMTTRGLKTRDPMYLLGNLYPHRLEVFVGENVTFTSTIPGCTRTFCYLQPGGRNAWPPAVELRGLTADTLDTGFFLFDEDCRDMKRAREKAEEQLAPKYLATGQTKRACTIFERLAAKNPDNLENIFMLGQAQFNCREYRTAIATLNRCITGKPGSMKKIYDVWAYIITGMCHDALGERDEAIKAYTRAIEMNVDFNGSVETARQFLKEPYKESAP
jgi:transglutaminase-like putative cysteine protease